MKKLAILLVTAIAGFALFAPALASAQPLYFGTASSDKACETLKNLNPDSEGCGASEGGVNNIIKVTLNLISVIAAIIAVIMVIVSGFKYITAEGDATQLSNSKKTLIYAIVGLVVVVFAQAIVKFVLKRSVNA
jgi:hypothetical protein